MTLAAVLAEIQRAGVRLEVVGDRLVADAPKGALTATLRAELVHHKVALLVMLAPKKGESANTEPSEMPKMISGIFDGSDPGQMSDLATPNPVSGIFDGADSAYSSEMGGAGAVERHPGYPGGRCPACGGPFTDTCLRWHGQSPALAGLLTAPILGGFANTELPKPSKPGFVGFVGADSGQMPKMAAGLSPATVEPGEASGPPLEAPILGGSANTEPSKPSKPGFVGFDGSDSGQVPEMAAGLSPATVEPGESSGHPLDAPILDESANTEPSKPSKPGFVGFDGSDSGQTPEMEADRSEPATEYIDLRGGLVLPRLAVQLALDLERKGFLLRLDADHQLVIGHAADVELCESDIAALIRWHRHVAALVAYQPPEPR